MGQKKPPKRERPPLRKREGSLRERMAELVREREFFREKVNLHSRRLERMHSAIIRLMRRDKPASKEKAEKLAKRAFLERFALTQQQLNFALTKAKIFDLAQREIVTGVRPDTRELERIRREKNIAAIRRFERELAWIEDTPFRDKLGETRKRIMQLLNLLENADASQRREIMRKLMGLRREMNELKQRRRF